MSHSTFKVMPDLVHGDPAINSAPSAMSECVTVASAASSPTPVVGMGGGSTEAVDLASAVMDPATRASRLHRQRSLALAASEALVAEARRRWASAKRREVWDDISVLVVLFFK